MEKSSWPAELDEMIKPLWREPHADRQIELAVFIDDKVNMDGRDGGRDIKGDSKWDLDGTKRRRNDLTEVLDACLLTDEEFALDTRFQLHHITSHHTR